MLLLAAAGACGADPADRALDRSASGVRVMSVAAEDSILAAEQDLATAARVGAWARRFATADSVRYLFGLAGGGYAAGGELVADRTQDCVSLLYRCTELARARDHRDAARLALATRFAGADPAAVVRADGRVDYDHPAHLDYSLDMIRSGLWGDDVTATLTGARSDSTGSSRYAPGSFLYVPGAELQDGELQEGDIVWFVLSPQHAGARALREEHGLVIGHIGIVVREGGEARLVHAAVSGLEGHYAGGTVVTVPLAAYLPRVERFVGVCVTRFTDHVSGGG